MSHYSIHSSKPDAWTQPRPSLDSNRRRYIYGPIQPMVPPSLFDRLFGRR